MGSDYGVGSPHYWGKDKEVFISLAQGFESPESSRVTTRIGMASWYDVTDNVLGARTWDTDNLSRHGRITEGRWPGTSCHE